MIYALAITGPTASGKTALSIEIAQKLGCEIISSDSMQIYKYMDIGTAKATEEERRLVPHHLLDIITPDIKYSANDYRTDAIRVAKEIDARGKNVLFVGGTGLYISTLIRQPQTDTVPKADSEYQKLALEKIKTQEDIDMLWERLNSVDPISALSIHKNNVRRVIRALEIYDKTGKPKSYFDALSKTEAPDIKLGVITIDFHSRENLYRRVDMRVDEMMMSGLVGEARFLYENGYLDKDSTAYQAIGYKELFEYFEGGCTLSEAAENIKLASRRYAKRQLTWFRHQVDAVRIYADGEDGVMKSFDTLSSLAVSWARDIYGKLRRDT